MSTRTLAPVLRQHRMRPHSQPTRNGQCRDKWQPTQARTRAKIEIDLEVLDLSRFLVEVVEPEPFVDLDLIWDGAERTVRIHRNTVAPASWVSCLAWATSGAGPIELPLDIFNGTTWD